VVTREREIFSLSQRVDPGVVKGWVRRGEGWRSNKNRAVGCGLPAAAVCEHVVDLEIVTVPFLNRLRGRWLL
jgi:hypothetical protein